MHIDFGFMLSNSPGGMHFERAPFKLTAEYMQIMDSDVCGTSSPAFGNFKVRSCATVPMQLCFRLFSIALCQVADWFAGPCSKALHVCACTIEGLCPMRCNALCAAHV